FVDAQRAQRDATRVEVQARPLGLGGGQRLNEVVQRDVRVGLGERLLGGAHQVVPADLGEVAREGAVAEQAAGVLPVVLAALDQFVVSAAAPAGGEGELVG